MRKEETNQLNPNLVPKTKKAAKKLPRSWKPALFPRKWNTKCNIASQRAFGQRLDGPREAQKMAGTRFRRTEVSN
jgi:hypothetical protein